MKRDKEYNIKAKLSTKCKCGHSITLWNKNGYFTCKWCGRLVFVNRRAEMKFRQKGILAKLKKDLEDK